MSFNVRTGREHQPLSSLGILLTNLGTPDAPTTSAVRRYLKEFLSDPRVVEQPRWLWWLVLNGVILNIRPRKSAEAYKKVWTEEGSPLLAIGKRQRSSLEQSLRSKLGDGVHVELAMRYGNPSVRAGLDALRDKGCKQIIVLPLYPQYSATTTASTFDAVADVLKTWRRLPGVSFIDAYHDHPAYIAALSESVRDYWKSNGDAERLLLSYHGIPERYLKSGDPYPCHCRKTSRLLLESLELGTDRAQMSFQSRFGREPWVGPATDATLKEWGAAGVKSVDVMCPGFAADCLETVEEIDMQNREFFVEAGGLQFRYIPALNDREAHIDALTQVVMDALPAGWAA